MSCSMTQHNASVTALTRDLSQSQVEHSTNEPMYSSSHGLDQMKKKYNSLLNNTKYLIIWTQR